MRIIRRANINANTKENRFLDSLEQMFTGAKVEGDSGFVNLMRMKHDYFRSIRPQLMDEIDRCAAPQTSPGNQSATAPLIA